MDHQSHLDWPFFEPRHRVLAGSLDAWADAALHLWGGHPVEQPYREIRALRIYEGASEVQRLIIGRDLLRRAAAGVAA